MEDEVERENRKEAKQGDRKRMGKLEDIKS